MAGAKGVLINITAGSDITLFEVDEAANRIREEVDAEANIIFGSTFDESLEGRMRVSVVSTGIGLDSDAQPRPVIAVAVKPATEADETAETLESVEETPADEEAAVDAAVEVITEIVAESAMLTGQAEAEPAPRETAEAVAAPQALAVQICPDVIEVDTGKWDGLNWDEIQRDFPEAYHSFMHTPETHGYPGGETMSAVLGRGSAAIEKLMSEHLGRSIALVAHNVVIKCYLGHLLGLPSVKARSLSQKNCAINLLRYRREKIKLITLGAVFHLDEAAEKRG